MYALQVRQLRKSYAKGFIPKRVEVLKDISFTLPMGAVSGFLGANGSGKTSTLKCVLGLSAPDSGALSFFDGQPLSVNVRSRIGFLPERPYFYEYLTGREFLRFYGQISTSLSAKDLRIRIEELLKKVGLSAAGDKRLRVYSKGMLQRIGLAQALIHNPEFVILDEPMAGLDPDGRHEVAEIIRETAQRGTAVFFSSHLLNDAEKLCDYLVIINAGKSLFEGSTKQLMDTVSSQVEITYLQNGRLSSHQVVNTEQAQPEIDRLRRIGAHIHEVRQSKMTLEELFVSMAKGERQL